MIKFAAAYSSLLVGFMVMFMILFSEQDVFNSNFFGVFGKVIIDNNYLYSNKLSLLRCWL